MKKTKIIVVRITEDHEKLLEEKTKNAGLTKKSEYIRLVLFSKKAIQNE